MKITRYTVLGLLSNHAFTCSTYVGEVLKGKRHGTGTYYCAHTGVTYTGSWVGGAREGRGKLVYDENGLSYYDGEWASNQMEGYGMRKYR